MLTDIETEKLNVYIDIIGFINIYRFLDKKFF